jgi:hypothetical protein
MGNVKPLPNSFFQDAPQSLGDFLLQVNRGELLQQQCQQYKTATGQQLAQAQNRQRETAHYALLQQQASRTFIHDDLFGLDTTLPMDFRDGDYKPYTMKEDSFYKFHSEMERERSKPKKVPVEWRFIIVASILGYLICELIKEVIS